MIKANELRIGNLAYQDKELINGIVGCSIYKFDIGMISLEPILLTEEWFVACGFEKINHIGDYSFWSLKRKRNSNIPSIDIYSSRTTIGNNSMVKHCEYLHQLQNLYFALTGEELVINIHS